MKTKIYLIIIAALLLSSKLYSQQNDFVRLDGKRFMLGCDEFYPKVMNFSFEIDRTPSGQLYIAPYNHFRNVPNCKLPYTQIECRNMLKAQMQMVKDLGFNSIRLCGLEITTDALANSPLMIHYPTIDYNINEPLLPVNYPHIYKILDSVFALAAEVDLKVIYLVGSNKMEKNGIAIEQYRNYLDSAAKHFANQSTLMAYDLYNEPSYVSTNKEKDTVFMATWQWYRAIRDNTPNQLVTIGIAGYGDAIQWDPGIMPLDFISFHYYPNFSPLNTDTTFRDAAPSMNWLSKNLNKPWIIGETGLPGDTSVHSGIFNLVYKNIANYADTIKRLNLINGSSGFSWFNYQDICSYDLYEQGNFFGIMNRRNDADLLHSTQTSNPSLPPVDGLRKLADNVFVEYNPNYAPPSAPQPSNYYNFWSYSSTACKGTVTGPNGVLKDAVVFGWKQLPVNNWKDAPIDGMTEVYKCYGTFSDENGEFILKTNLPNIKLCGLWVSYLGMVVDKNWGEISLIHNSNLAAFPLNYGPGITEFNDYVIKSGQSIVWNNPAMMAGNLIIQSGGQLTVKSGVFFNSNRKIIVEKGGKLIVDGGKLTSGCENSLWQGIEVQGNPNQMQNNPLYQGYVELKNGATIENAVIGVHCVLNAYMLADNGGAPPYTSYASGGIVIANNSTFRNNKTAINIEHYFPITYYSGINVCAFEYPNLIPNADVETPTYIKLTGVKGVNISQNNFNGNINNLYYHRGIGIEAHDATFAYNSASITIPSNTFNNMSYGIACYNTSTLAKPEISLSAFTDCWRAIYLSTVADAKVINNTINYKSQSTDPLAKAYGIYLDNCNGYQVEGNMLSVSDKNAMPENGIVVNNSGTTTNRIYRNTFTKIQTPIAAQNVNRNTGGSIGLQLLCNNINECLVNDMVVTYDDNNPNLNYPYLCGIKMDQGSYSPINPIPAGNLFTKGGKDYKNYTNTTPNMVYYARYSNDLITYNYKDHYLIPRIVAINPKISNQNTNKVWNAPDWETIDCPNNTANAGGGKSLNGVEGLKEQIEVLQPRIDSANTALLLKMDHGNSTALINRITTATPANYQTLYNDLRNYSPYLSEEVLLAVIHKQGFPSNMLVNLMLVNTHVAKTPLLMEALQQKQPPLPSGQIKQIANKINVFSVMEIDRMKISNMLTQRDYAYNTVESYYAHDSLADANDSLGKMLVRDPRLSAKYDLVYHYLANNDSTNADLLANQIPQLFSLDAQAQVEYNHYKQLYDLKRNLQREGKNFMDLSEAQQQILIEAINNPSVSIGEMNDLNALRQVAGMVVGNTKGKSLTISYKEPILEPIENKEKDFGNTDVTGNEELLMEVLMDKVLMEQNNLQLYPNPASNMVNVLYNISSDAGKVSIEINDVTGKIISTYMVDKNNSRMIINTLHLNKGIYYVILKVDNKSMKVEKLVIQ